MAFPLMAAGMIASGLGSIFNRRQNQSTGYSYGSLDPGARGMLDQSYAGARSAMSGYEGLPSARDFASQMYGFMEGGINEDYDESLVAENTNTDMQAARGGMGAGSLYKADRRKNVYENQKGRARAKNEAQVASMTTGEQMASEEQRRLTERIQAYLASINTVYGGSRLSSVNQSGNTGSFGGFLGDLGGFAVNYELMRKMGMFNDNADPSGMTNPTPSLGSYAAAPRYGVPGLGAGIADPYGLFGGRGRGMNF